MPTYIQNLNDTRELQQQEFRSILSIFKIIFRSKRIPQTFENK